MKTRLITLTGNSRAGTTLTEVLMSMMILSIGVLSLASLFPIGILSSVRATQLTHAVTLKNNADARIALDPGLVVDPDRNHDPLNGPGQATGKPVRYIVDPLGSIMLSNVVDSNGDGLIAQFEDFNGNGQLDPGEDLNGNGVLDGNEIPPLWTEDTNGNGQLDAGEDGNGNGVLDAVYRYNALYNTLALAEELAALPDSWTELAAGPPLGFVDRITVKVDSATDVVPTYLTPNSASPQLPLRIMLVDPANGQSHASLIDISNQLPKTIKWYRRLPIPIAVATTMVTDIRVQQRELKYSYLLSVRRDATGSSETDVVVFFRRTFSHLDEAVYSCDCEDLNNNNNLDPGEDLDGDTFLDGGFRQGVSAINIRFPSTANPAPLFRSGGYLLDAENLRWYRINSIEELPTGGYADQKTVRLTLQQPIVEASSQTNCAAMIPAIIQVFSLGDR